MLKWSSEDEVNTFCAKICSLFDPKFTGTPAEQDAQSEIAFATAYDFAKKCELTSEEFLLAFNLASEGKLKTEEDSNGNSLPIQLYREVNAIKLGELKSAYIRYKAANKGYELGKEKVKAFLSPPERDKTPEELAKIRMDHLTAEYHKLQKDGFVHGSNIFYELIKKGENLQQIKLSFVESFLDNFTPEFSDGKNAEGMAIIKKKDVKTSFVNHFVLKYIKKNNLKELSLNDWINYWEKFTL